MTYEFIAAGNVMLDKVIFSDGTQSGKEHIGGPATFAYSGIRLFTDNVIQCSNVGADYEPIFQPWLRANKVDTRGFKVICARSNHSIMRFKDRSGAYYKEKGEERLSDEEYWLKNDAWQDFGYLKTRPEEISALTQNAHVKGVYLAQNADRTVWEKLGEIRRRDGFKLMWEIEGPWAFKHYLQDIKSICTENIDAFSINIEEAQNLFDCTGDQACIAALQYLDVDLTLFRVGERGAYVVTATDVIYLPPAPGPVVDPTGCGNTSTGAALYAYAEGMAPLMVGILANVASSMNIRQYGIIPDFAEARTEAETLVNTCLRKYQETNTSGKE